MSVTARSWSSGMVADSWRRCAVSALAPSELIVVGCSTSSSRESIGASSFTATVNADLRVGALEAVGDLAHEVPLGSVPSSVRTLVERGLPGLVGKDVESAD